MQPIEEREQNFKDQVFRMIAFPKDMLQEFFDYWSEPSRSGKLRWEMEKTWDLKRRLTRWQQNQKDKPGIKLTPAPKMELSGIKEVDDLDKALRTYSQRPSDFKLADFRTYYEVMLEKNLLGEMTVQEKHELKVIYDSDFEKCKAARVQKTFDGYVNGGITFAQIMGYRKQLNG